MSHLDFDESDCVSSKLLFLMKCILISIDFECEKLLIRGDTLVCCFVYSALFAIMWIVCREKKRVSFVDRQFSCTMTAKANLIFRLCVLFYVNTRTDLIIIFKSILKFIINLEKHDLAFRSRICVSISLVRLS